MSDAPTRCCVPATSGRCANAPAPHGQTRYIGPVEVAACNLPKHQASLRSLPAFTRRDGYCGADGCHTPSTVGLCETHRNLYRRHGVLPRLLLATEPAPMVLTPLPVPAVQPPPTPEVPDAVAPTPTAAPESDATVFCVVDYPTPEALLSAIFGPPKVEPTAPGPTMAELQEQVRTLQAQLTAAKVNNAADLCDAALSGLRIVAESGPLARVAELEADRDQERLKANEWLSQLQDARKELEAVTMVVADYHAQPAPPAAPLSLPARVAAALEREREGRRQAELEIDAITAALDADPERSPAYDDNDEPIPLPRRVEIALMPDGIGHSRGERRAHELEVKLGNLEAMDYPGQLQTAIAEIETACVMLRRLGGTSYSVPDLLMQVLSPEDRRAILEVEAAEGRATIARLKARRVNPPPPEKLAEYAGKLARAEAQIAALDHSPDAGNMVS